jgi:hypothetical protein
MVEGQTNVCAVPFSGSDGIKHCFKGSQVCSGGYWGACLGNGSFTSYDPSKLEPAAGSVGGGGGLRTMSLSSPAADAGVCAADPCNPYCIGFSECSGTGSTTSYDKASNPTSAYANLPAGRRGNPGSCTQGATNQCRHDFKCNTSNSCVEFAVGETSAACALPDFTMGMPCNDGTTWKINVCNRGTAPAIVGTLKVTAHTSGPSGSVGLTCPPGPGGAGSFPTGGGAARTAAIDLASTPIVAGGCRSFNVSSLFPSLTADDITFFMVNTAFAGPVLPECNPCNNYTSFDDGDDDRPYNACVPASPDAGATGGCPLVAEAGAGSSVTTVSIANNGLPPGQAGNLFIDKANTGRQCEHYGGPGIDTGNYSTGYNKSSCQADTHCIAGESSWYLPNDKNCHQWLPGEKWAPFECGGIDLNIGLGCTAAGKVFFPICNRGNAAVPPNTPITVSYSAPAGSINSGSPITQVGPPATGCPTGLAADCTIDSGPTGLLPGACISLDTTDVTVCPAGWAAGTKNVYINPDYSVVECDFGFEKAGITQFGVMADKNVGMPNQRGCANNWSVTSNGLPACTGSVPILAPTTYAQDYHAVCPVGTRATWSLLTWESDVPADTSGSSELIFAAQTAPDLGGGGIGAYVPAAPVTLGDACDPTKSNCPAPAKGDPALCLVSGPGTCATGGPSPACCPKAIGTALGGLPASTNENLRLTITLKPTPNAKLSPVLRRWDLSYDCVPAE